MQMEHLTLAYISKNCLKMDPRPSSAPFVERALVTPAVLRSMLRTFIFLTHLFIHVGSVQNHLPKRMLCTNTSQSFIKVNDHESVFFNNKIKSEDFVFKQFSWQEEPVLSSPPILSRKQVLDLKVWNALCVEKLEQTEVIWRSMWKIYISQELCLTPANIAMKPFSPGTIWTIISLNTIKALICFDLYIHLYRQ